MSYISREKRPSAITRISPSFTAGTALLKRESRFLPINVSLFLMVNPNNGGIYLTSDDLMPNATITYRNSCLSYAYNITDHDDTTYALDACSSVPAQTEITEISYDLGNVYNGFIYVYMMLSAIYDYARVYTSPDNSTWTKIFEFYCPTTGNNYYTGYSYVSSVRYIKLTFYNATTQNILSLNGAYQVNSLEFYPLPGPRTYLPGSGTNVFYTIFVYNTYYELLEVWNI